jgi:predicted nucleic acid-binding Zn ribbon protein
MAAPVATCEACGVVGKQGLGNDELVACPGCGARFHVFCDGWEVERPTSSGFLLKRAGFFI